jgi:hypothetical protein
MYRWISHLRLFFVVFVIHICFDNSNVPRHKIPSTLKLPKFIQISRLF